MKAGPSGVDVIMRVDVVCVGEGERLPVLVDLLLGHGADVVPVIDGEGRPRGVVTKTDVLRCLAGGAGGETAANQVMTSFALALPSSASSEQAAALMAYEGVEQILITDDVGAVVGVVAALDVARHSARGAGYLVDRGR